MEINFKKISPKLKKIWQDKFDQLVICFVLILVFVITIFAGFITYQSLIKIEPVEISPFPKREIKINEELKEKVLKNLEERKKSFSSIDVEKIRNPFPED